jgi:hypothetical protein
MAYSALQLITNAYYLSGIVARQLQTVSGQQITDGLYLFNALLAVKTADKRLIPYYTPYTQNLIIGQEEYYIENLLEIESISFNLNNVRYAMNYIPRRKYFGQPRVNNIETLPFSWHMERTLGGANLYVYFLPDNTYQINIIGKFSIPEVTLDFDLTTVFDLFYIEYFRYALAAYICSEYTVSFNPQSQQQLNEYELLIMDTSPIDLTTDVLTTLSKSGGYNFGDVNLGKGWRP